MIATTGAWVALLSGLMASGHCVAMCGPMTALGASRGGARRVPRALLYHGGRLLSYATAGALFGSFGYALGSAAGFAQGALIMRVGLGVVLLLIGVRLLLARTGISVFERAGARLWRHIAPLARRLRPGERLRDVALMGLLWGWIPCGMVYSMLAIAAVSGNAASGAATMLAFGIGTLPAMLGMTLASQRLQALRRPGARRALGAVLVLSGVWLAAMPLYHALPTDGAADGGHHHRTH